ncbi:unnamed protein product [Macrosiphum euphorbiae]|uniref:HAT C-terminal dimerisation domain-containing protein n=1 Tax=Macrosiphum euphorbiae TaxID=13131 RepID=A0AAV0XAW1_9HEMI|nr:unnamed protein product [Macrosiphum euphorbiae]
MYLSTPVSSLKTDPLISWEELKPLYPFIYNLALKYLSGVCTSVPSEGFFLVLATPYQKEETDYVGNRHRN